MWFVVIGVVMLGLKVAAIGPVAQWSWWWIPAPFVAALLWWQLADHLGWTLRDAQRRDKQRQQQRRAARADAMGLRRPPSRFGDSRFDVNSREDAVGRAGPATRPEAPASGKGSKRA